MIIFEVTINMTDKAYPDQAVIQNQMPPSLNLFVSGILVRLQSEEWRKGVLPGPLHVSCAVKLESSGYHFYQLSKF